MSPCDILRMTQAVEEQMQKKKAECTWHLQGAGVDGPGEGHGEETETGSAGLWWVLEDE